MFASHFDFFCVAQKEETVNANKRTSLPLFVHVLSHQDTVHMVRSAARSAPSTGNPAPTSQSPPASNSSAAQGIPASFGAGQAYGSDPLAALNRADFAGPHMAQLGDQMFRGTGLNPNDPNMLMTAMQSDEFRDQMRAMLGRPEVIDQIVASNPQLASLPGARELLRSEQFREFLLDPQSMQRAAELSRTMGGAGGMGGLGGLGGFAGFGTPGGGQDVGIPGEQQWPPPGAFGQPLQPGQPGTTGAQQQQQGATNPRSEPGSGMFSPAFLQQLLGGAGGGANPFGAPSRPPPADTRPPEERYAEQLAQMQVRLLTPQQLHAFFKFFYADFQIYEQSMGLTDGAANLRALLTAGGSVEGAMSILFDDPSGGRGGAPGS